MKKRKKKKKKRAAIQRWEAIEEEKRGRRGGKGTERKKYWRKHSFPSLLVMNDKEMEERWREERVEGKMMMVVCR